MAKKSMKNWFGLGKKATNTPDEDKVNPALLVSSDDETAEEKAIRRAADLQLIADFEKNSAASKADNVVAEPEVITAAVTVESAKSDAVEADVMTANVVTEDVAAKVDTADSVSQEPTSTVAETETVSDASVADEPVEKDKFFSRLKRGLARTKGNIGSGFKNLFRGKHIDDELFEELEEQLLIADLGVATTTRIIDNLTQQASRRELKDAEALYDILKKDMADMLHKVEQPLAIDSNNKPHVILMVGVNGVGKTTTIGKMAKEISR